MTSHPVPTALLPRLPCRSRFRFYLTACSKLRSGHAARFCLLSCLLRSSSASTNPLSLPVRLQLPALKDKVSPLWWSLIWGATWWLWVRWLASPAGSFIQLGSWIFSMEWKSLVWWKSFTAGVGGLGTLTKLSGGREKEGRIIEVFLID